MMLSISQLEFCRSLLGEALLAAPLPAEPLAALAALREECTAQQASAVLKVRQLRARAADSGKFPADWSARMLVTETLLQQASSLRLAIYVGRQLAAVAADGKVMDLCCGGGTDAIGIALATLQVAGYDIAPEAVLCATHNADIAGVGSRCRFTMADVTGIVIDPSAVVHVDPDRRAAGGRSISLAGLAPPGEFIRSLPTRTAAGAIKLSPATGFGALRDFGDVQMEYVSESGVCKQLIVWWGPAPDGLVRPARRAAVVFGEMTAPRSACLAAGSAPPANIGEAGDWLCEPDPAVVAAGAVDDLADLLGRTGSSAVCRIDRQLPWLLADRPVATPLGRWYRVLTAVPGRRRDVAKAVRELDGGTVEVKPRGVKLDTDSLQMQLRGRGEKPLTVLWGRIGQRQRAFIAERGIGPMEEMPDTPDATAGAT
ncbi:MAG: hypothetical protein HQ546_08620 [Planctomycetes bacterium]|nr:hypothetical protein [Planctomycetota bacterium]